MDNLLPTFRPATQTYYGMHIPLVKTQVKQLSTNSNSSSYLIDRSKIANNLREQQDQQRGHRSRRRRNNERRNFLHFRRPFDAVRLQPTMGREPRARPREQLRAAKKTGWKFTTLTADITPEPQTNNNNRNLKSGVVEYDGFEIYNISKVHKNVTPAKVRKLFVRERSLSPPRLTQAAMDAVRIDTRRRKNKKPSTAPTDGKVRHVFVHRSDEDNVDDDLDRDHSIREESPNRK